MTTPTPTPEKQDLPAVPYSEGTSPTPPQATGFFNRIRGTLKPEKANPSEEQEIVDMEDEGNDRT
jgi:hypothetical protein